MIDAVGDLVTGGVLLSFPVTPMEAVAAFLLVAVGAAVQAVLGFGLSLIAAPLLLLIHPSLVPGPLLAAGITMTAQIAYRERDSIDFKGLRFALGGRVLGTLLAAGILTLLSPRAFYLLFSGLVALGVALSASGLRITPGPALAAGAGVLSGFMATLSSIGGPPMALLYQRASGPELRGTLSAYFMVGAMISLAALAVVGHFGREEIILSLFLVPAVLVGYGVSGRIQPIVDRTGARPFVLGLSLFCALAVLIRAL